MLSLPPSVRVFLATQPVDGRKGTDSLVVLVRDVLRHDPLGGHLFVFFSKRCDRVRIVYLARNGFAMWSITTLVATHDLELVLEICSRAILLDQGVVVADGPSREVLGDAALVAAHGLELPISLSLPRPN